LIKHIPVTGDTLLCDDEVVAWLSLSPDVYLWLNEIVTKKLQYFKN